MTSRRMQSTALALGVIATVSVMITATASDVDRGFENLKNGQENVDFPATEWINGTVERVFLKNNTIVTAASKNTLPATVNRSETQAEIGASSDSDAMQRIDKLQRDQSETGGKQSIRNDPPADPSYKSSQLESQRGTSDERSMDEDYSAWGSTDTETTSIALAEVLTLQETSVENENVQQSAPVAASRRTDDSVDLTALIDERPTENTVKIDKQDLTEDSYSSVNGSDVRGNFSISYVENSRGPKAGKDVRNVRTSSSSSSSSFQLSSTNGKNQTDSQLQKTRKNGAGKIDGIENSIDSKKDHSRPSNNLLLSGKSTKAFYEIKPSIKTEIDCTRDQTTTSASQTGPRFVLPSVDSAFGKFGPYFEDGEQEINMTARIGTTVLLDCKIGMLGDKKVTWVQHGKDSFRLLTVGRIPYSVDQRISLQFRYPSNWRLQILYATPRDSGLYQCQVATHPPLVKKINVIVTAPLLTITDDSGRTVAKERHLKAGSALRLRCEARDVLESQNESVVWTRGEETLVADVSENRTTEIPAGKEVLVIVSTLIVERASPRHAGNYSCLVPGKAKTTIAVHVLNGELPAAVHDGSGVSRAVLNLWLIHLTVSYIFFR